MAIAVSGPVPAGTTAVTLVASPDLRNAEPGRRYPSMVLERAVVQVGADGFVARVDPVDVPGEYIQEDGLVDFEVRAKTSGGVYITHVSARAVVMPDATEATWADPGESAYLLPNNSVSGRTRYGVVPRLSLTSLDGETTEPELEDDGVDVKSGSYTETDLERAAAGCFDDPTGDVRVRSTTIGTTYPVGNSTAHMVVTSSQGAEYGIASSMSGTGGWSQSGTKFTKSGWGKEWLPSSSQRSYRKGVEYTKVHTWCSTPYTLLDMGYKWKPTGESGGTDSNVGIDRPNWTKCAPEDPGPWWRDDSGGGAYSYGAAVKFAGVLGIDLSIKREWSSSNKLRYDIVGDRTKLCGNNDDWPSVAGKLMQKWR